MITFKAVGARHNADIRPNDGYPVGEAGVIFQMMLARLAASYGPKKGKKELLEIQAKG